MHGHILPVSDMMTVYTEQDNVMAAVALPLHWEVTAVACRHHSVSQIVPLFPTSHTLVLLAVHIVGIHSVLLITGLVHKGELDRGRVVADALSKAPVL